VCKALTVAELTCILILTGVSSCVVVTAMSIETYTRLLLDASPEFPIHFLNIYSSHGFRMQKACHPALKDIAYWTRTKWFIEFDIEGYFDPAS
jgi:hypothetical protein